ncbi:hypothetical protein [Pseudomonas fulva]|uniref:hypothetical protein n=1 Tax=Pseudomonas fulva TaxID=47880 RepID=UPI0018A97268|nr:hypothetical protein [Pseudomonas fulva]MBF8694935.1 hypothetical protein [Pseudomonas fulva]
MPLIQIEQDDPRLINRLRDKIARSAEVIRQSYGKDELRGVSERNFEIALITGYLAGMYEQQLLSESLFADLNTEWEEARAAASVDPMTRALNNRTPTR